MHDDYYKVRFANEEYCRLIGVDLNKILGMKTEKSLMNIHPDDVHFLLEAGTVLMKPNSSIEYEYRVRKTGMSEYFWLLASSRSISEDGITLVFTSIVDITENKVNQDLSLALEAEKKVNETKMQFLSNMSHEIRTPMNAIIGMTELAQKDINNRNSVENYLSEIDQSSHYLLGIINDILDMSRIESGKLTFYKEWVSPKVILQTCLSMIKTQMERKHIDFEYPAIQKRNVNYEYNVDVQKIANK